jgi:phosphopantothenoylcysteine decarboxylase / phosphopantothenate---cysteine ligase
MTIHNILIGVTGSIAAFKSAELVSQLKKAGFSVRVVMTKNAQAFVTPMTLQVLSEHTVYTDTFDQSVPMIHIELARWADLILIAPASADTIARLAHAAANDLLSSICLATKAHIYLAPAMNQGMWHHEGVQKNIQQLRALKIQILPTQYGIQACGDVGYGRMLEPETMVAMIQELNQLPDCQGMRVLITAGPTQEAIDPVRYLSNHSSGKMGYALAESFALAGAVVTLISGPTVIAVAPGVKRIDVVSAESMQQAVLDHLDGCDIFIAAAAVSDFKVAAAQSLKIKKTTETLTLTLVQNPDILKTVAINAKRPRIVVGFAAETDQLLKHAEKKLFEKNCDMIVANLVSEHEPFYSDSNQVWVLQKNVEPIELPRMPKQQLAFALLEKICQLK